MYSRLAALAVLTVAAAVSRPALADPCRPMHDLGLACEPARRVESPERPTALKFRDMDRPAGARLNGRWYLGRDDQRDFGLVRRGERSEFSLTDEGLRLTFRF